MKLDTLTLTALGHELDVSPEAFGELTSSKDLLGNPEALRARMKADGYLYLPGLLDREEVLAARREVTDRLQTAGHLDPAYPPMDAVAQADAKISFLPEVARNNGPLSTVLYSGAMMDFFARFLGGPVLHYDFTWFRAVAPGKGAPPHADVPYMGRGTHNVYTAWTPIGDVNMEMGGLMVLEGTRDHESRLQSYYKKDVDSYCTNGLHAPEIEAGKRWWGAFDGVLSKDPPEMLKKFGGRWLTTGFSAGDVLIFSIYTVHGSLDNHSKHIRLSSDSRYQLASEPVDQRWMGENPAGHGVAGKRGRIC
ncbi:MAG TPA: phytanoyl-CoA dioxygenase family protein [Candidatus Saccharimonadales bacterium]|nr:phytanoyl-CoA dioxygenase family protein [Candidatus Saccharimonadales bacterium]